MARAQRWDLSSETVTGNFLEFVGQMRLAGRRPVFELVPEKRSLDQNDMINAVYRQIAAQSDDQSFKEIRAQCKLDFGVPIRCQESAVFRYGWENAFARLPYEKQLIAIEQMHITSDMGKKAATEYIDTVIREYSKQGYSLIHPSEADSWAQ